MRRWIVVVPLLMAALGCGTRPAPTRLAAPRATPPEVAGEGERAEKGEIAWIRDYDAGMAEAKNSGKPVMLDAFATWCGPCKLLDETVFSRADVAEASKAFVAIRIDGDKNRPLLDKLRVTNYPTVLFLTPEGKEIRRSVGAVPYQNMLDAMAKAQQEFAAPKRSGAGGS